MDEKLNEAISLYKQGNKIQAAKLLSEVVQQDPNNSTAWYGLALCLNETDKKIYCLKRVLELDSSNQKAQQLLEKLQSVDIGTTAENIDQSSKQTPAPANVIKDAPAGFTHIEKILLFSLIGLVFFSLVFVGTVLIRNSTMKAVPTPIPPTHIPLPSPTPSIFTRDPEDFIPTLPDGFSLDNNFEQINKTLGDGTRVFSIKYENKYYSTLGDLSGVFFVYNIFPDESDAISGYEIALDSFENEQKLISQDFEIEGADISKIYLSSAVDSQLLQASIISRVNNNVFTTISLTPVDTISDETIFDRFVADLRIIHLKGVEKLLLLQQ